MNTTLPADSLTRPWPAQAPRRTVEPLPDPLPLLAAILYRPVPAALVPLGLDPHDNPFTPACMLWRCALSGRRLPDLWAAHGMASQHGPDPLSLALCPALLARFAMLPDGVTVLAAEGALPRLPGCGHGVLRTFTRTVSDTILIPAQLVRALISTDGTLPPHPAAAVAA